MPLGYLTQGGGISTPQVMKQLKFQPHNMTAVHALQTYDPANWVNFC